MTDDNDENKEIYYAMKEGEPAEEEPRIYEFNVEYDHTKQLEFEKNKRLFLTKIKKILDLNTGKLKIKRVRERIKRGKLKTIVSKKTNVTAKSALSHYLTRAGYPKEDRKISNYHYIMIREIFMLYYVEAKSGRDNVVIHESVKEGYNYIIDAIGKLYHLIILLYKLLQTPGIQHNRKYICGKIEEQFAFLSAIEDLLYPKKVFSKPPPKRHNSGGDHQPPPPEDHQEDHQIIPPKDHQNDIDNISGKEEAFQKEGAVITEKRRVKIPRPL